MSVGLEINSERTAVIVIDLQKGITSTPTAPHPSNVVIENTVKILTEALRKSMPAFLVHVTPSPDLKDALHPVSETTFQSSGYNPSWSEFVPELNIHPSDFLILKHQWVAFYGTELDLQLRRRRIDTIILCGISTNFGVESTARFAYELGFNQIFVSDAMAARSREEHEFPLKYIFPRLGLIRTTDEVFKALSNS